MLSDALSTFVRKVKYLHNFGTWLLFNVLLDAFLIWDTETNGSGLILAFSFVLGDS